MLEWPRLVIFTSIDIYKCTSASSNLYLSSLAQLQRLQTSACVGEKTAKNAAQKIAQKRSSFIVSAAVAGLRRKTEIVFFSLPSLSFA
jgi:hypothetical protein